MEPSGSLLSSSRRFFFLHQQYVNGRGKQRTGQKSDKKTRLIGRLANAYCILILCPAVCCSGTQIQARASGGGVGVQWGKVGEDEGLERKVRAHGNCSVAAGRVVKEERVTMVVEHQEKLCLAP